MLRYSSSLRVAPIAETLAHARRLAPVVGITRVTEITRLDRIGLPVFAGIRPDAQVRSLCVSSGKGLTADEARIGAYMEAIELAYAEPARARPRVFEAAARDVLGGAIGELCPWEGKAIPADARLPCVEAEAVIGDARAILPAEIVLFPVVADPMYFGSDGNGIASGNSLDEATVHGLTEVIERDATSFLNARDESALIAPDSLPPEMRALVERLDGDGFDLVVRAVPTPFGIPVIKAMIRERAIVDGVHFGYACHLGRDTALARAVSEAIQCRLSVIHGGRDDLTRVFGERAEMTAPEKLAFAERQVARNRDARRTIRFDELPDHRPASIEAALQVLVDRLAAHGLRTVLRVALTPTELPLQVVRVVVPGLEMYAHGIARVGPRLRAYLGSAAPQSTPREASR